MLFIAVTVILVLLGVVMVFSASSVTAVTTGTDMYRPMIKQLAFALVGLVAIAVLNLAPYSVWTRWLFWAFWILCMILLVLTLFFGEEYLGARRWLKVGELFTFQPSEFAKIAIVMAGLRCVQNYKADGSNLKLVLSFTGLALLPTGFIFVAQNDFGTTLIIVIGLIAVLLFSGINLRVFLPLVVVLILLALVLLTSGGFRSSRIDVWLNPWNDGDGGYGTGWQSIRARYAFACGGLFGVGLGNSYEKFQYLPMSESDFIYAVIGEELGFVGAIAVVLLFLLFLVSGLMISQRAEDEFGSVLAASLVCMLVFQAFVNMGCATGLLPTTGKPLPFVSAGLSSLGSSLMIVGIVLQINRGGAGVDLHEKRRDNLRLIRVEHDQAIPHQGHQGRGSGHPGSSYWPNHRIGPGLYGSGIQDWSRR